jgi:hypothetical protein
LKITEQFHNKTGSTALYATHIITEQAFKIAEQAFKQTQLRPKETPNSGTNMFRND